MGGSLEGLPVVKVAVAGGCHDYFMARLCSLHAATYTLHNNKS